MRIAPPPIAGKITRFIENRRYAKEQKFLNTYCQISNDINGDAFVQLNKARKTIANYAKSKGVKVEFSDAAKTVARETFEYDIDEKYVKKAAQNQLKITIKPLKKISERKGGILSSISEYVSKDTSKTHLHTVNDHFVVEIPSDETQIVRPTKHEYEDNFLRHIYRVIENNVKVIEHFYKK